MPPNTRNARPNQPPVPAGPGWQPARTPSRALLWLLAVLTLVVWIGAPSDARAEGEASEPRYVLETEHFRFYFREAGAALVHDVADRCEAAHALLTADFGRAPDGRTHVLLITSVDDANGLASVIPRNRMELNLVVPRPDSTLATYDDWLWNLIVHEYTHILHLGAVSGLPGLIDSTRLWRIKPNSALPNWLIEGLATWQESRLSGTGRLNDARFRGIFRAAVLAGRLPRFSELSGAPTRWPQGTSWYVFGAHFAEFMIRTYGWQQLVAFIDSYGHQIIPLRMNATARRTLGASFPEMWEAWAAEAQRSALAEAAAQERPGLAPIERLPGGGGDSDTVEVAYGGRDAVWLRDNGVDRRSLVWAVSEREVRFPDGDDFVFTGPERVVASIGTSHRLGFWGRDLFEINLQTSEQERLTWGERAWLPAGTRDELIFTRPVADKAELWVRDRATGESTSLVVADEPARASDASVCPDGSIVFSLARPGQGTTLAMLGPGATSLTQLLPVGGRSIQPFCAGDGDSVYFSSDRTGVNQLYRLALASGEVQQLTGVATGAFSPVEVTNDDGRWLYFTVLDHDGYHLSRIALTGDEPAVVWDAAAPPFAVDPRGLAALERLRAPPAAQPEGAAEAQTGDADRRIRRRPAILGLELPSLHADFALFSAERVLGGTLKTQDESRVNSLWLSLQISFVEMAPYWAGTFTTRRLWLPMTFTVARTLGRREGAAFVNSRWEDVTERQDFATISVDAPLSTSGGFQVLSLRYELLYEGMLRRPRLYPSPTDLAPIYPDYRRRHALNFSWYWSNVEQGAAAPAPQFGAAFRVGTRLRSPFIGAEVESADVTMSARTYASLRRWPQHTFAFRVEGGVSAARGTSPRVFSVGGLGSQDIFVALRDSLPSGNTHVRGYLPWARNGDRFHLLNLEYRFPVFTLDEGLSTLPVFGRRLTGAFFVDAGNAFAGPLRLARTLVGVGAELRLDGVLGYSQPAAFRLGLARGLTGEEAITDFYALYGWSF